MAFRTAQLLFVVEKFRATRDISLVSQSVPAVSFGVCGLSCEWNLKSFLQGKDQRKNKNVSVQDFQLADEREDLGCRGQVLISSSAGFLGQKAHGRILQVFAVQPQDFNGDEEDARPLASPKRPLCNAD